MRDVHGAQLNEKLQSNPMIWICELPGMPCELFVNKFATANNINILTQCHLNHPLGLNF